MPEGHPGIYIEELSFGPKAIEGVSTSVCGFVGPTLAGPTSGPPELLTSLADFERIYGGFANLEFASTDACGGESQINYMAYAARAFFENGGRRLYVARVYESGEAQNGDGVLPSATAYEGVAAEEGATGLEALADVNEISIVAAPGSSARAATLCSEENSERAKWIAQSLIDHCRRLRNRVAVLDSPDQQSPAEVKAFRAEFDSKYGALYYPWVIVPAANGANLKLPPSGFVAGIYARVDEFSGVFKSPANEVIQGLAGLETLLTDKQQAPLNVAGINCLRHFPGRGFLVWGARTMSSDPEWKYVNVRRYLLYLENSIAKGTQWVVFEPNQERVWANVRRAVEDFLQREWRSGALIGSKPEAAYFVRCDRTTMTQNDIDNGRLICVIGVAPVKPAEFVIFRIGQWTADRP